MTLLCFLMNENAKVYDLIWMLRALVDRMMDMIPDRILRAIPASRRSAIYGGSSQWQHVFPYVSIGA